MRCSASHGDLRLSELKRVLVSEEITVTQAALRLRPPS
jgi:hypothetical protein